MTTDADLGGFDSRAAPSLVGMPLFAASFTVAATLTVVATLFALSGGGPLGPASPIMLWMLGASLAISCALGVNLALRIRKIASRRWAPNSGARLHLRFVALFSAAAVVPAVVVALFLGATMSSVIENWFNNRVQNIVENGALVGRTYVAEAQEDLRGEVMAMSVDLNGAAAELTAQSAVYRGYLEAQARQRRFAAAYVVNGRGEVLAAAESADAPAYRAPEAAAFRDANKGRLSELLYEDEGLIRALNRLPAYPDAYLYVMRSVSPAMLNLLRSFEQAVVDYRVVESRRGQLQVLFSLSYLASALLVLLVAVWLGLSNATRIAQPIGRLAEAARRVAAGDLQARVDTGAARDEVGALGEAFNQMTAQLDAQRAALVRARQEAEDRSNFTQTVLTDVSAGVLGLDRAGRVTVANASAAELLEIPRERLEGRSLVESAPEFEQAVKAWRDGLQGAGLHRIEILRGGVAKHLSVRVSGGATGLVLTFDDMTKLVAAQRQEAWKDVARRIAHEIKNPLTPIQLSAERIRRKYSDEITSDRETFQRCTDTILRQVADIGRMVDEFSGFARMPAAQFEGGDLAEVVREAVFAQRISHVDVRFELEGAEQSLPFVCDGRLLGQALGNILKNAAEAIATRRNKTGEPKEGFVRVQVHKDDEAVRITVTDNGVGFPLQDRERLVEPYVTTRSKGTGLGLAIVRRVVEDHGGTLTLGDAPPPGPGATVTFILPRNHSDLTLKDSE